MYISLGVFFSPFTSSGFKFGLVSFVKLGDLWDQWVIRIGVCQEGRDGQENFGDGEGW